MKRCTSRLLLLASGIVLLTFASTSNAQFQVFSENFDADNSSSWTANPGASGNHAADFYFDYSTVGIPSAPHSVGGTTRGLKLLANFGPDAPGVAYGISASPNGVSITGDYEVYFDMWCNFNGPAPAGGSGSTQITGAGIGSSGTYANYPGRADGLWMAVTGDGNSTDDYRVYSPAFATSYQYNSDGGVYASGTATTTRNNTTAYWTTNFPGQTPPAAQTALYAQQTGTANNGAQAFKWREVVIKKAGNEVTFKIDGILIATVNAANAGTLGGGNLLFVQADINATISTDPNRTFLTFGLIDNVRVTNLASVVSISAPVPFTVEGGSALSFIVSRNDPDVSAPLTVNLSLTGTAVNGSDYQTVPLTATIPAGSSGVDITVNVIDDSESEFLEIVEINVLPGTGYSVGTSKATAEIADNDKPTVSVQTFRPSAYERVSGDYIQYRLVRKGDTGPGFTVALNYSGTAASGKYTGPAEVFLNGGNVYEPFDVTPVDNSTLEGDKTVIATVVANGPDYNVDTVNNSATGTIIDDELPAETPIFSANFNSASDANNWTNRFGTGNGVIDYEVTFGFDYAAAWSIPAAPHGSDTLGLFMTVNKTNAATTGAAAVNVYPLNQSFSGDFAVRFDMYARVGAASTSEYALMGINHAGDKTNWFRLSGNGFTNSVYDGVWAWVEVDATGSEDYMFVSSPVSNNGGSIWSPKELVGTDARAFTNVFKAPPWFAGTQPGGSPANAISSSTPTWADVELSQVAGVVKLKINQVEIMRYTNTTAYTSGNIMLGYADPFDSVGSSGAGVVYDNLRVIDLNTSVTITDIDMVGGNVEITFDANASDTIGSFTLQKTGTLNTGFADTTATFSSLGGGTFKAVRSIATDGNQQFYRIRK